MGHGLPPVAGYSLVVVMWYAGSCSLGASMLKPRLGIRSLLVALSLSSTFDVFPLYLDLLIDVVVVALYNIKRG